MKPSRKFTVVIEQDEEAISLPPSPPSRMPYASQNLDTLMKRIRQVISLCLEEEKNLPAT